MTQIRIKKARIFPSGEQFFPITHTKAVIDDNGYTAESRLGAMQDEINQAQLAVGAVPSDLTPTEDSTNWVTSGGVYNALTPLKEKWKVLEEGMAALTFTDSKASGYMLVQSGTLRSSEGSVVCDYYDISGLVGKTIKVTCSAWVSSNVSYDSAVLTYNSGYGKVRAFNGRTLAGTTISGTYIVKDYEITVQEGENYIRICSNNSSIISLRYEVINEYDAASLLTGKTAVGTSYDNTNSKMDSTDVQGALDELSEHITIEDINAPLTFTSENASGYIMRPSGDFVASSGYVTCDYYYIGNLVGKVIKVTTAAWVSSQSKYDNAVIVYNANKGINRAFSGRTLADSTTSAVYIVKDYEITVQSGDAYIRINSARSSNIGLKHDGFVKEKVNGLADEIEDIKSSIQVMPDLEFHEYDGEKVEIEKHKFAGEFYMSFSATGTIQGGASYDNYYVISSYDSSHNIILTIYDLSTKTSLGSVNLGIMAISNTHANTVVFSNQFHTEGDTLPVLYICSGYGSGTTSQVYAYRLVYSDSEWTATLIQTITLSSNATISWAEFVPDNENGVCWIKTDAWYRTSLPLITAGDVTIDMTSLTAIFPSPSYTGSGQGHLFYNNKIYFPSNISGGPWHLNVLDTTSGELVSVINIGQFYANEPEHCFIYDSHLYVGYQGKNVYKLYFD